MGLIGKIASALGVIVLAVIGLTAYLYFTDYAVEAQITEKGQDADGRFVTVSGKLAPVSTKQYLEPVQWAAVCEGDFVLYNLQTERVRLFDQEGGTLIYDSAKGLVASPVRACTTAG